MLPKQKQADAVSYAGRSTRRGGAGDEGATLVRFEEDHSSSLDTEAGFFGRPADQLVPMEEPEWLATAPCCVATICRFLYFGQLIDGDPFVVRLRKLLIGLSIVLQPGVVVYWLPVLVTASEVSTAIIVAQVVMSVAALLNIAVFVVYKCYPDARSAVLNDVVNFITIIVLFYAGLVDVDFPMPSAMMKAAVLCMLARTPRLPLQLFVCFAGFALFCYNKVVQLPHGEQVAPIAAVPGFHRSTTVGDMAKAYAMSAGLWIYTLIALELQLRQSLTANRVAEANNELAADLAADLVRYDTELAEKRLEAARQSASADPFIIGAFTAMVANLTKFRPHLPNWLLLEVTASSEEGTTAPAQVDGKDGGEGDEEEDDEDEELSDIDAELSGPESSGGSFRSRRASTASGSDLQSPRTPGSGRGGGHPGSGAFAPERIRALDSFNRKRIVYGEFGFRIPLPSDLRGGKRNESYRGSTTHAAAAAAANGFVDRVYSVAAGTGAAVHSFVGDAVTLTWNATNAVVQAEVKAARFAARLRADAGHELAMVWGALVCGNARVRMAGASGKQQGLLVSVADLGESLERIARVAGRFGVFVANAALQRGAAHAVEFRGAGLQRWVQLTGNASRPALTHAFTAYHCSAQQGAGTQHGAGVPKTPGSSSSPLVPGQAFGSSAGLHRVASVTSEEAGHLSNLPHHHAGSNPGTPMRPTFSEGNLARTGTHTSSSGSPFNRTAANARRHGAGPLRGGAPGSAANAPLAASAAGGVIYEVIAEHMAADNDEWMYVLEKRAKGINASVNSNNLGASGNPEDSATANTRLRLAVEAVAANDLDEATALLKELPDEVCLEPLVAWVLEMMRSESTHSVGVDSVSAFVVADGI